MKVTVDEKKGVLLIEMPIASEPAASKSGKTKLVASTQGAVKTGVKVQGEELTVNLNAYIPNKG